MLSGRALVLLAASGCSHVPQMVDVMRQPPVCDLPAPTLSTPVARFPTSIQSDPDYATLIGFVADSMGRVLGQGQLLLSVYGSTAVRATERAT